MSVRIWSALGPCDCGNEPWDSIKGGELNNTNDCQLIKYYFVLPRHVVTRVMCSPKLYDILFSVKLSKTLQQCKP